MTKEQKFLLLVVLIIAGASVAYYYTQSGQKVAAQAPVTTTGTPASGNQAPSETPSSVSPSTTVVVQVPTTTVALKTPPIRKPVPVQIPSHSFSSDVTYITPEDGSGTIHVTMSLSGDTINDITFTYNTPTKRESKEYLASFERSLATMSLKGTKLSALSLSRTGGASLTTGAFMEAIAKIRTQATNG